MRRPTQPPSRRAARSPRALSHALAPAALAVFFTLALTHAGRVTARAQQPAAAPQATPRVATAAAGESQSKGTIAVRVVGDDNQPVANAVVMAQQLGVTGRFNNDNSGATTGRYVLANLEPGIYRVMVYAPGYVEEADPLADPDARNLFRPGDTANFRLAKGGVITGRVTDAAGEPVVGTRIKPVLVRDAAGRPATGSGLAFTLRERRTDDRGVYRLYGLNAGTYVVLAGGQSAQNFGSRPSAYDEDAPTYYPSATRDGAVEVQVQVGQELADVDIRYRGEQGHAVSGTVAGAFGPNDFGPGGASVALRHVASGTNEGFAFVSGETRAFTFGGVADGEYELTATSTSTGKETGTASAPLRVTVRGADVVGLRLSLAPLATLSGRLAFEPPQADAAARPECRDARRPAPQEAVVFAARDRVAEAASYPFAGNIERTPDERGEFALRNLTAGRYRLGVRLLDDNLFVRSMTVPASAAPASAATDAGRNGVALRAGEQIVNLTINVAAGAASVRGRLAAAEDGERPAGNWRVHLVPTERERAEDVPRYAETLAQGDGTFSFRNLAPGRYLLVARAVPEADLRRPATLTRPAAWDAAAREALRREAEAAKKSLDLRPCQRAEDFTLRTPRPASN